MVPAERNKVSLATARVVPIFLVLITAYVSYTLTGPLAVEYLLNPPHGVRRRVTIGLTIPIVYCLLLIPVAATWLRLLVVVWRDPGYVPLGRPRQESDTAPVPGLEYFYGLDAFVCDYRGLPIWCSSCNNWKPDRAHHNQDVGRCTMKMDHFCPWVGGVVGERSYKFFVQFNLYSLLLSAYATGVLAYFVAEKTESTSLKIQWCIALGLSAFFCLFTLGMIVNSVWMTLRNVTTIENINAHSQTMLLAVRLPPELQGQDLTEPPLPLQAHLRDSSSTHSGDSERPFTSELDDPSHSSYFSNLRTPRPPRRSSILPHQDHIWRGTITYPFRPDIDRPPLPAPDFRTFAILETLPGMQIWDIGRPALNFRAVFGRNPHDWLLPVKHSPCCDHSSLNSQYPLGPDFSDLLVEAGLSPRHKALAPPARSHYSATDAASIAARKKRRKRKRRLDAGWQNGERPDGWVSEKEARRVRKEERRIMQGAPRSVGRDAAR